MPTTAKAGDGIAVPAGPAQSQPNSRTPGPVADVSSQQAHAEGASMRPVLSICIPTRDRPEGLRRALESAMRHASAPHEVELIVSDNSTTPEPGTCARGALAGWPGPSRYVRNEPALGMVENFNNCVALSSGQYVYILHDDDYLLPGAVDEMIASIRRHARRPVLLFGVQVVDGDGQVLRRQVPRRDQYFTPVAALRKLMTDSSFVRFPGVVVQRAAFDEVGVFDPSLRGACDVEMWGRLFARYGVQRVSRTTSAYTVHEAAATASMFNEQTIEILGRIFERLRGTAPLHGRPVRGWQRRFFSKWILAGTFRSLRAGRADDAREVMTLFDVPAVQRLGFLTRWLPVRIAFLAATRTLPVRGMKGPAAAEATVPVARTVTIVVTDITRYRIPFYEGLTQYLAQRGVTLRVIQGGEDDERRDKIRLPSARQVPTRVLRLGRHRLRWQPAYPLVRGDDLVIVSQQSGQLLNYLLLARQFLGRQRVAYWGHGRNFQRASASRLGETLKRWTSRRVHWWFAYNQLSARIVAQLPYPTSRITDVQNAIDTRALERCRAGLDPDRISEVLHQHGLKGVNLAVYAGGLYQEKRIPLLLEAATRVRESIPDFELVVIGAGRQQALVEAAAAEHDWLRYLGPVFDDEKVPWFAAAKLMLLPGLVGLAILDSFALRTPMITLADSEHSPEIDYLVNDQNGVLVPAGAGAEEYASEVVRLLDDEDARSRLVQGCQASAERYTIEEMVQRFGSGILRALEAPQRPLRTGRDPQA